MSFKMYLSYEKLSRNSSVILLSFFILFLSSFAVKSNAATFTDEPIRVGSQLSFYTDESNSLSFQDVKSKDFYSLSGEDVPNLGISNSTHWAKFEITNSSQVNRVSLLITYAIIDQIEVYLVDNGELIKNLKFSEVDDFENRFFPHQDYLFTLPIPQNKTYEVYLKAKSSEEILLPAIIGEPTDLFQRLAEKDAIFSLYLGVMLVMFLYNLFLYASVKDRNYLYYVFYIFCVFATQACALGFANRFLHISNPYWANFLMVIFPSLSGVSAIQFIRIFLNLRKALPKLNKLFNIFQVIYAICIILGLFQFFQISQQIILVNALIASLYIIAIAIIQSRKKDRTAHIFLVAWSVFLLSVIVYALRNFGVVPYNNFTTYILLIGSALEAVLLSFALADKIKLLEKEKKESQARELSAVQENEKIVRKHNIELEQKVHERTIDLQTTLNDLKKTQVQLVNSEKMASLGQLTAGIAHEINNPINFVTSNISPLKRDFKDLVEILDRYDVLKTTNDPELRREILEIEELKEEIEIDYVKEEIETLLKGIEEGADRTANIVLGLKTFSRLDEDDMKMADINEGLDSTLTLLNNKIKHNIELDRNYGDIPLINCYPGKLNQVFMNILTNAIQALDEKKFENGETPTISIRTTHNDDFVFIEIADNGPGIKDEDRNKIFDPFFTTKDVGVGTGLGMSIAYKVIESHDGEISFESEINKGVKFNIKLPNRK